MKFAIVIPTANRLELLKACVGSISQNLGAMDDIDVEVLVGFNQDVENFRNLEFENINIEKFYFEKMTPSDIRNELIKKVSIDCRYILFLDDDIILPVNYLKDSLTFLVPNPVSVLGGSDSCYPGANSFEKIINYTIQSPMVTSATRIRHIVQKETSLTDECGVTLSNLWIKTEILKGQYKFNSNYFRNEENVLLDELVRAGHQIIHLSNLFVFHKRRNLLKDFWYPSFRSGYFRMKSLCEKPRFEKAVFLIPLTFLYFNIISLFFNNLILFVPAFFYLLGVSIYALKVFMETKSLISFLGVVFLQPVLVLAYAFGQFSFFIGNENEC